MASGSTKKGQKFDDLAASQSLLEYDEPDALPPTLRYNNFDMSATIISISTYLFDLVRGLSQTTLATRNMVL